MSRQYLVERNKKICVEMGVLIASGKTLKDAAEIVSAKVWNDTVLSPAAMRAIYRYSPFMLFDGTARRIQGLHKRVKFIEEKISELKDDMSLLEKSLKVKLESH